MTTAKQISEHAHAAKLIRAELKRLKIAGSVRSRSYSGGDSVDVYVTDLAPAQFAMVEAFAEQFAMGHFDGSDDSYRHSNRRNDIPQVYYVHVNNSLSDALRAEITEFAYNQGLICNGDEYGNNQIVRHFFNGIRSGFWNEGKTEKAAA